MKVCKEVVTKIIPVKKKRKKAKWLSDRTGDWLGKIRPQQGGGPEA